LSRRTRSGDLSRKRRRQEHPSENSLKIFFAA
jgi:hypothetical protein